MKNSSVFLVFFFIKSDKTLFPAVFFSRCRFLSQEISVLSLFRVLVGLRDSLKLVEKSLQSVYFELIKDLKSKF